MIVYYWECLTHECGSTRFNNLTRHSWEDCDIRRGSSKKLLHNTWHNERIGGLHGDISRKFYKDWDVLCARRQKALQKIDNWKRQADIHEANVNKEVII